MLPLRFGREFLLGSENLLESGGLSLQRPYSRFSMRQKMRYEKSGIHFHMSVKVALEKDQMESVKRNPSC